MIRSLFDGVLDRSIVFSFDRTGFRRHSAGFDPADLDVDLAGRVCLVTGANAGLGRVVSRELAQQGGEVWMLVRDPAKGAEAAEAIRREIGGQAPRVATVDVSSLASVRAFIRRFAHDRIDVLVNNAGVLPDAYEETPDGLELTLATNLVGPFLLTSLLVPRLARSNDARVVTVSSGGMYTQKLVVSDLKPDPRSPFDGTVAYARTKRAQVILTELWSERYRGSPITWSSMHPGWADTPGVRTSLPRFWTLTRRILRSPEEGADTIVWLAVCQRVKGKSGQFWFDRRVARTHLMASTVEAPGERAAFWRALHEWAGVRQA